MDNSTSVREAAVELLGRFVLSRPQLTEQYYDMLIERILVIGSCALTETQSVARTHTVQGVNISFERPCSEEFG